MGIPQSIVSAEATDSRTSNKYSLGTKSGSNCQFFDRFPTRNYEIQLRLDWNEVDSDGNPMLDADVYLPGETKPIKESVKFPSHHTPKLKDQSTGLYIYEFTFDGTELSFRVQYTHNQQITAVSNIVAAPENSTMSRELTEWLQSDEEST
jgi:hypothetical protein